LALLQEVELSYLLSKRFDYLDLKAYEINEDSTPLRRKNIFFKTKFKIINQLAKSH